MTSSQEIGVTQKKLAPLCILGQSYCMTKEEFIASGQRAYGSSGWQKQVAARLSMNPATINRYARGRMPVPVTVELAMRALAERIA